MQPLLMRSVKRFWVLFVSTLFLLTSCTETQSSGEWLSSFTTITTPMSSVQGWHLSAFSCADPSGNIYISGTAGMKWVILKSSDGGSNWTQVFSHGSTSYGHQIVSDSQGNIFAVGAIGNPEYGTIKKFSVSTGLWTTAYTFQLQSGKLTYFRGITIDSNDHIYVIGEGKSTLLSPDAWPDMDVTKMIALKSTDHGSTWSLIDSYAVDDYGWTSGLGIYAAATGEVYAYGNAQFSDRSASFVRKSTNAGATWTRVYEDAGSILRGLVAWGSNLVYSEDFYNGTENSTAARVRGTSDTFDSLTLIHSEVPEGATTIVTGSIKVDSKGHAYFPLSYYDADSKSHLALMGNGGDGKWVTLDDHVVSAEEALYVNEVMIDGEDSVYNLGIYYSESAGTSWILRKATLSNAETVTPNDVGEGSEMVSPAPTGAKRIYITSTTHAGNWGTTATNAIANADAACNSDPNIPINGTATYKAMIVNSVRRACVTDNCSGGALENLNWVLTPNTAYVSREGVALGATNASGIFTNFSRSLLTNHVDLAWTALETSNINWTNETETCNDWTSNDENSFATIWTPRASDFGDIYTVGGWMTCDKSNRLICVEQ